MAVSCRCDLLGSFEDMKYEAKGIEVGSVGGRADQVHMRKYVSETARDTS